MRIKAALLMVVIALAAVLAACGSEATSADCADSVVATVELRPLFDSAGFVLRDTTTDLPVYAATRADGLRPVFETDGRLRRCPVTDSPLYRHGEGVAAVLVRVAR